MTGIGRSGRSRTGDAGAGSSSSRSHSSLAPGEGSQSFDSVVERMRSGPQDRGTPSASTARGADDALGDRSSGPSVGPDRILGAAARAAAAPRAVTARRRGFTSVSEGGDTAPVASQPTSGVAVSISSSEEEINAARRHMGRLREELAACGNAGMQAQNSEEALELADRFVKAGSAVLEYYASVRPAVARSILSDAKARRYCYAVLDAGHQGKLVGGAIIDALEKRRKKSEKVFQQILESNATPDQLSRVASSMVKDHVPVIEWWGKKLLRSERMQSVCETTANLPSTTPEMRKANQAAQRLHTGSALYDGCLYLEARIKLAKLLIESQASTFEPTVRDALMDENGRVRLLGTYIQDAFPAFLSTYKAVLNEDGEPLDAEHCTVLEGVMERHSELASGVERIGARLRDAGTDADLLLDQLDQIMEGAWVTAHQVTRLLAVQPKRQVEPPAQTAISEKSDLAAENHAARRKGKGKRAPAAGEGSSTARLREPQLARPDAATASTAKVIVLSDLGTKKLASAEEARARASSSATGHLAMWEAPPSRNALTGLLKRLDELLQFDLPAQQSAVSQARQMKPEDADHVVDLVLKRLQTQAIEIKTCVAALEEPRRRGLLKPAQMTEVHNKIVRLKAMLSEVQGQANSVNAQKAAITIDCMKTYAFPSQKYLEQLRAAEELASVYSPQALKIEPATLFEIKLQPKALRSGRTPNPMWVHIHTKLPVRASQLATLGVADFAACHVKSHEQRGYNRQWQSAQAATGHENVVIHRGKLTPAFCKSLLSIASGYSLPEAEHASMQFARLRM
ncbi:hypothetical protein [Bradyrhizobium sp. 153]|uniref:hypothetical protein n=1 Tax=Bradyrhizobium sp. 153 TaxID=2782627 RepID=UPI001FF79467|nr:hypothetical protein [Bradyrhizobium sp. 153]